MKTLSSKTLNDVCEFIVDCLHNTAPIQDEGYPLIRTPNIGKGNLLLDDVQRVSHDTYKIWTRRATPQKNDLILAREAPAGNVALIRDSQVVCLGQRTVHLRPNPKQVNPYFLCIYLLSPKIQAKLLSGETGATSRHVNMKDIRKLIMDDLPDLTIQNTIASIIESYSILIDTNRRRIQLLEKLARLLFREWFVFFRFPRLRQGFGGQAGHEKACPVESINSTGVKIVNGMPEGWRKRRLVEVADITMGQSPKSEYYNDNGEGLPFHQGVTGFGNRYPTNQTYCTQKNRMAQSGDILFSVRAPVGRINISTEKIIIGRGISAIRSKENHQSYLFYELKNHFFKEDMIGGGAIFAAITKKDLETVVTIVPDEKAIDQFENITNPIDRQIFILSNQNQKLAQARDLLLPRLMSGAIEA